MVDLVTLVMIYVMLGWGLNIVVGLAGLLDLGYVAFYAVGAYSYTLLAIHFDLSFWSCLPLAGAMAALFGVLLGFPVLRLRGDYLAIVTLGFGEMIRIILINWSQVTGGSEGITGIPAPSFFGLKFTPEPAAGEMAFHQFWGIPFAGVHKLMFLYYIILALAVLTHVFSERIRRLPIGRAWEALREDEIASRSLGLNPVLVKLSAFGLGAPCSPVSPGRFSPRGRGSSTRPPSPSSNRRSSWRLSCSAAWAARSASSVPPSSSSCCLNWPAISPSSACCCSAARWC